MDWNEFNGKGKETMKRASTQYLNVPKWSEMHGLRNSNQVKKSDIKYQMHIHLDATFSGYPFYPNVGLPKRAN